MDLNPVKEIAADVAAYEVMKEELRAKALGKVVAIKGGQLIGIYNSRVEAIRDVTRRYGHVPVLVRKVK